MSDQEKKCVVCQIDKTIGDRGNLHYKVLEKIICSGLGIDSEIYRNGKLIKYLRVVPKIDDSCVVKDYENIPQMVYRDYANSHGQICQYIPDMVETDVSFAYTSLESIIGTMNHWDIHFNNYITKDNIFKQVSFQKQKSIEKKFERVRKRKKEEEGGEDIFSADCIHHNKCLMCHSVIVALAMVQRERSLFFGDVEEGDPLVYRNFEMDVRKLFKKESKEKKGEGEGEGEGEEEEEGEGKEEGEEEREAEKYDSLFKSITPMEKFSFFIGLFHDIGKIDTRVVGPSLQVKFYGHAISGGAIVERIAKPLFPIMFPIDNLNNKCEPLISCTVAMVANYMRYKNNECMSSMSLVYKLMMEANDRQLKRTPENREEEEEEEEEKEKDVNELDIGSNKQLQYSFQSLRICDDFARIKGEKNGEEINRQQVPLFRPSRNKNERNDRDRYNWDRYGRAAVVTTKEESPTTNEENNVKEKRDYGGGYLEKTGNKFFCFVCGSSNVGKTFLCNELAKIVTEAGKDNYNDDRVGAAISVGKDEIIVAFTIAVLNKQNVGFTIAPLKKIKEFLKGQSKEFNHLTEIAKELIDSENYPKCKLKIIGELWKLNYGIELWKSTEQETWDVTSVVENMYAFMSNCIYGRVPKVSKFNSEVVLPIILRLFKDYDAVFFNSKTNGANTYVHKILKEMKKNMSKEAEVSGSATVRVFNSLCIYAFNQERIPNFKNSPISRKFANMGENIAKIVTPNGIIVPRKSPIVVRPNIWNAIVIVLGNYTGSGESNSDWIPEFNDCIPVEVGAAPQYSPTFNLAMFLSIVACFKPY